MPIGRDSKPQLMYYFDIAFEANPWHYMGRRANIASKCVVEVSLALDFKIMIYWHPW